MRHNNMAENCQTHALSYQFFLSFILTTGSKKVKILHDIYHRVIMFNQQITDFGLRCFTKISLGNKVKIYYYPMGEGPKNDYDNNDSKLNG